MARNSDGDVIIFSWDFIGLCSSVDEAELRAYTVGLYISITLHKPIILESDCSFVASFLANSKLGKSILVDLKCEACALIGLLQEFKLSGVNRRANLVAHELAKFHGVYCP